MSKEFSIEGGQILIREFKVTKLITLNRPRARNALSARMLCGLIPFYRKWMLQKNCVICVNSSTEDVFSSGGDIKSVALGKSTSQELFAAVYTLTSLVHNLWPTYGTPHVSLLNGITMGGGLGFAVQGSHRICTESTSAAMPECSIGFFPDATASYFLPRLKPAGIGHWMALTGSSLHGADTVRCGLGTHFVSSKNIDSLTQDFVRITSANDIERILKVYTKPIKRTVFDFATQKELLLLQNAFIEQRNIEGALSVLSSAHDQTFPNKIMMKILQNSPTSIKVTWNLLQRAHAMLHEPFENHTKLDYLISQNFLQFSGDFFEGVRAKLIDKTNDPKWTPNALSDIEDEEVKQFFVDTKKKA